jgi:hypothetical protein
MHDLDTFISPIPGFEGDIPIPAIPVSARPPSGEAIDDPSAEANVGASKTRASKRKATTTPKIQNLECDQNSLKIFKTFFNG